jgi:hypothetical protein
MSGSHASRHGSRAFVFTDIVRLADLGDAIGDDA